MKDDRRTRKKKQQAYAESILLNAILINGRDEALRVLDDLNNILKATLENVQLADVFRDQVDEYEKESSKRIDPAKVVRKIFAGASEAVLDTLSVMAENRDLYLCMSMYETYNKLLEEHFDVVVVNVVSAVELDDHLRELIKTKAQNELDANIALNEHVDKNILGGVILSARNRIIDCSLLTMMERAKSELTSVHHYG